MSAPRRIRLSRAKGWRLPPGAVSVARPTKWGNPFRVADCREAGFNGGDEDLRAFVVDCFRRWIGGSAAEWMGPESDRTRARMLEALPELRGRDLACWCPLDQPCHADVLLERANRPEATSET